MMKLILASVLVAAVFGQGVQGEDPVTEDKSTGCYYYCAYKGVPYCCGPADQPSKYGTKNSSEPPDKARRRYPNRSRLNDDKVPIPKDKKDKNDNATESPQVVYSIAVKDDDDQKENIFTLADRISQNKIKDKNSLNHYVRKLVSENKAKLKQDILNPEESNVFPRSTSEDEATLYREDVELTNLNPNEPDIELTFLDTPLETDINPQDKQFERSVDYIPEIEEVVDVPSYKEHPVQHGYPVYPRFEEHPRYPTPFLVPLPPTKKDDKSMWKFFTEMMDGLFKEEKEERTEYLLVHPPSEYGDYSPIPFEGGPHNYPIVNQPEAYLSAGVESYTHPHLAFQPNKQYPHLFPDKSPQQIYTPDVHLSHPVGLSHEEFSEPRDVAHDQLSPEVLEELTRKLQDFVCPCRVDQGHSQDKKCTCDMKDTHVVFPPEPFSPYIIVKAPHLRPNNDIHHPAYKNPVYPPTPVKKIPAPKVKDLLISPQYISLPKPHSDHQQQAGPIITNFGPPVIAVRLNKGTNQQAVGTPPESHGFIPIPQQNPYAPPNQQFQILNTMPHTQTKQHFQSAGGSVQPLSQHSSHSANFQTVNQAHAHQQNFAFVMPISELGIFDESSFGPNSQSAFSNPNYGNFQDFVSSDKLPSEESDNADGFSFIPSSMRDFFSAFTSPLNLFSSEYGDADVNSNVDFQGFPNTFQGASVSDVLGLQSLASIQSSIFNNQGQQFADKRSDSVPEMKAVNLKNILTEKEMNLLKAFSKMKRRTRTKRSTSDEIKQNTKSKWIILEYIKNSLNDKRSNNNQ